MKGEYDPIPKFYSNLLRDLIKRMINIDPKERDDAKSIVNLINFELTYS